MTAPPRPPERPEPDEACAAHEWLSRFHESFHGSRSAPGEECVGFCHEIWEALTAGPCRGSEDRDRLAARLADAEAALAFYADYENWKPRKSTCPTQVLTVADIDAGGRARTALAAAREPGGAAEACGGEGEADAEA